MVFSEGQRSIVFVTPMCEISTKCSLLPCRSQGEDFENVHFV